VYGQIVRQSKVKSKGHQTECHLKSLINVCGKLRIPHIMVVTFEMFNTTYNTAPLYNCLFYHRLMLWFCTFSPVWLFSLIHAWGLDHFAFDKMW